MVCQKIRFSSQKEELEFVKENEQMNNKPKQKPILTCKFAKVN
jgi:hypothetical protein